MLTYRFKADNGHWLTLNGNKDYVCCNCLDVALGDATLYNTNLESCSVCKQIMHADCVYWDYDEVAPGCRFLIPLCFDCAGDDL